MITRDGYILRLPPSSLAKIASQLDQSGLKPLVKRYYRGSIKEATARSVAQVVRKAQRIGPNHLSAPGVAHREFSARTDGRHFYILTRPFGPIYSEVISIRPQLELSLLETRTMPGFTVTVTWRRALNIERIRRILASRSNRQTAIPTGPGVYLIEKYGKPIYVGISIRNLKSRWRSRLRVFNELEPLPLSCRLDAYKVRFGLVDPTSISILRNLETALIRYLIVRKKYRLNNTKWKASRIKAVRRKITIENTGAKPAYLAGRIALDVGKELENYADEAQFAFEQIY